MERYNRAAGAAAAPSAPSAPTNKYFTEGNPGGGVAATQPGPWWFHMMTEEMRKVITDAGLTPDHTDLTQLSAAIQALVAAGAGGGGGNQGILQKVSSNLVLTPYNGNKRIINGVARTIPNAGVSLSASGLTPGTLYYIYSWMNGSTMTLEASTTGHSTDTTTGIEIKTGDATRTLEGMARVISGPAWADTAAQRFVRSWYNRQSAAGAGVFTANRTNTNTSFAEINTEIRSEFLVWAGEIVSVLLNGQVENSTSSSNYTAVAFDGTTAEEGAGIKDASRNAISGACMKSGLAEGYHYATLVGKVDTGTATYLGSGTVGTRTSLLSRVGG